MAILGMDHNYRQHVRDFIETAEETNAVWVFLISDHQEIAPSPQLCSH
ncbi:MAG: hypothetical protein BMS9Abin33_0688 [Gammaproteobacteria bacterium]|nr:MAG: hypothetical protein BMS9Abin33_0688 [Gammaproteobacteria bacterium]